MYRALRVVDEVEPVVSFKGAQFPRDVILHAVFFCVRYAVSYRDLEEILAERGVVVNHATLNRWVVKFASALATVNGRVKVSQRAAQNVAILGLARLPRERAPASGRPRFSWSWRLPGCFGP